MANLAKVRIYFESEIVKLEEVITNEKVARDSSPSAMESHSDTTKSQKEDLVFSLLSKLNQLKLLTRSIPDTSRDSSETGVWSIVYVDRIKSNVLIVPEGLGGVEVDDLMLVSINTPLVASLLIIK